MNKAEKSLRWVVNQIPDFKPTTNEEKMLVAIKLYSEAGAEEIKRLEVENAALRERLEKAVDKKVIANYLANILENPCNFSPIDEEMFSYCNGCKGDDDVVCWERVIDREIARLAELKGGKG